jgi:hypothetical protein
MMMRIAMNMMLSMHSDHNDVSYDEKKDVE